MRRKIIEELLKVRSGIVNRQPSLVPRNFGFYLAAFTVGDQLLWGVAEPLRRMLRLLLED